MESSTSWCYDIAGKDVLWLVVWCLWSFYEEVGSGQARRFSGPWIRLHGKEWLRCPVMIETRVPEQWMRITDLVTSHTCFSFSALATSGVLGRCLERLSTPPLAELAFCNLWAICGYAHPYLLINGGISLFVPARGVLSARYTCLFLFLFFLCPSHSIFLAQNKRVCRSIWDFLLHVHLCHSAFTYCRNVVFWRVLKDLPRRLGAFLYSRGYRYRIARRKFLKRCVLSLKDVELVY